MTTLAVTAVQTVECKKCHQPIASWDGEHIVVQRRRGLPFVEIPGGCATVQCHHSTLVRGRWTPCMEINKLRLGI